MDGTSRTGAHALVETLVASGVDTYFANPGTSEMHFVAALDGAQGIRCVLGLFEGVVTGAADGYWRMARKPAATLLHLGPGMANGIANLHNARKARSGIVNVVGNHGLDHQRLESPLRSNLEAIAGSISHAVRISADPADLPADAVAAVEASRDGAVGRISTLVLAADLSWGTGGAASRTRPPSQPAAPVEAVAATAKLLTEYGPRAMLMIGSGGSASVEAQELASVIATHTGCRLRAEFYNARLPGGRGRPPVERPPYMVDAAIASFVGTELLVLAGAAEPVAFFAYPGKPSRLLPPGTAILTLAEPHHDVEGVLRALADELGAGRRPAVSDGALLPLPTGALTPESVAAAMAHTLPEQAIVVDESLTAGRSMSGVMRAAAPHDWLAVMGGSIGFGLPAAVGASIGAPGRPVLVLEGDGSAMYTIQALWTMAREQLPVVVLILSNRAYRTLQFEKMGVGATGAGRNSAGMLSLEDPTLDWPAMARGHGVSASRVETAEALVEALRRGFASGEPTLIEAVL